MMLMKTLNVHQVTLPSADSPENWLFQAFPTDMVIMPGLVYDLLDSREFPSASADPDKRRMLIEDLAGRYSGEGVQNAIEAIQRHPESQLHLKLVLYRKTVGSGTRTVAGWMLGAYVGDRIVQILEQNAAHEFVSDFMNKLQQAMLDRQLLNPYSASSCARKRFDVGGRVTFLNRPRSMDFRR